MAWLDPLSCYHPTRVLTSFQLTSSIGTMCSPSQVDFACSWAHINSQNKRSRIWSNSEKVHYWKRLLLEQDSNKQNVGGRKDIWSNHFNQNVWTKTFGHEEATKRKWSWFIAKHEPKIEPEIAHKPQFSWHGKFLCVFVAPMSSAAASSFCQNCRSLEMQFF